MSRRCTRISLLLALLVACKDKPREAPAVTPAPTPVADAATGVDICKIAVTSLEHATCPTDAATQSIGEAKRRIAGIVQTVGQAADPRQIQVLCGQLLLAIERDATKQSCTLTIDHRDEVVKVLEAWYAQRTEVKPTGDAAADAFIAKVVAIRDATCACADAKCLDRVDQQLTALGTLPDSAPQAARDLGSKLFEDSARCAARVRTLTDPH